MAGIDDVKYASLLSVPLTTIHQPCADIGAMAIGAMLERLRNPKLPARDMLLNFHLVVRESCGPRCTLTAIGACCYRSAPATWTLTRWTICIYRRVCRAQ